MVRPGLPPAHGPPTSRRSHVWWLVGIAWLLVVAAMWNYRPEPGLATDAQAYHLAAEAIRHGGDPYEPRPPAGPHVVGIYPFYLYPPPFAAALSLFPLSSQDTYRLLLVLGITGIGLLSYALGRLSGIDGRLVAAVLLAFPGSVGLVMTGNAQSFIDGLAVLALVAAPGAATFLLASATAIKVTPVWPLAIVVLRTGTWRPLLAATALWTAATVAALGVTGTIDACAVWVREIAPTLAQGQFLAGRSWLEWNLSPVFAPLQALAPWPPDQELPLWARLYLAVAQFAIPALVAWHTRHRHWRSQAGWVMVAAALAGPILRAGYFPILLLIPALLMHARREGRTAEAHRIGQRRLPG